jgi:hypothetical protein
LQVILKVDQNEHLRNAPASLVDAAFFGQICYYAVHEYGSSERLLAFVEFTKDIAQEDYGVQVSQEGWGKKEFVDISRVRRAAGYITRGNKWYHIV